MEHLSLERDGACLTIRFARLPGGCMTIETVAELDAALSAAGDDDGVRVIIFTGRADSFVRHYSVEELLDLSRTLRQRNFTFTLDRPAPEKGFPLIARRVETLSKPVIAAINGHCMGGGFELALACDLRIAQRGDYSLGLPEVNIGLLPGGGGTQRLSRLIGPAAALEMMMRGRTITPDEALRLGIVHELADDAHARALGLAGELAVKSAKALGHIKYLVRQASLGPSDLAMAQERTLFLDLLVSDAAERLMDRMLGGDGDIRKV